MNELNLEIAGCERCPQRLIEYQWLPVGYFGDFEAANVWIVSINPSHREFLGRDGRLLRGPNEQRFAVLDDDPSCPTRPTFAARHLPTIIDYQNNFFHRNPYRGFFNHLGRFVLKVHGVRDPEPLRPFRSSLPGGWLYCHMDIVKCATPVRWSDLAPGDQTILRENCQGYLARQAHHVPQLRWILINGKEAMASAGIALSEIGFRFETQTLSFGYKRRVICRGSAVAFPNVRVLGWSANVVNEPINGEERRNLTDWIRRELGL